MSRLKFPCVVAYLIVILKSHNAKMSDPQPKPVTVFDNFCETDELYKPYVRYYKGRHGARSSSVPFRKYKPDTLLTDFNQPSFRNTYICVNGLTWLYYANTTDYGYLVFEQPELHMFVHHCFLVNYVHPPGTSSTLSGQKTLMALLLMGDPDDYRQPHISLIRAPSPEFIVNDTTTTPFIDLDQTGNMTNATSFVIFGDDTECILTKGRRKTQIRVRTGALTTPDHLPDATEKSQPDYPGYAGTFCKLSYPHINTNLDLVEAGVTPAPTQGDMEAKIAYALDALAIKNGEDPNLQRCEKPDNYTEYTQKLITERKDQIAKFETQDDEKELLDVDHSVYFNKKDRLPEADPVGIGYGKTNKDVYPPATDPCLDDWVVDVKCYNPPNSNPPPCPVPAVQEKCEKANQCYACDLEPLQRLFKVREANAKTERTNPDPNIPQKDKDDKAQLELDELLMAKLLLCRHNAWQLKTEIVEVYKVVKAAWDELEKNIIDLMTKRGADHSLPYYEEWQKAAAAVSKGETLRSRLETVFPLTNRTFQELVSAAKTAGVGGDPKCTKVTIPPKSDYLIVKRDKKVDYLQLPPIPSSADTDITLYPSDVNTAANKTCATLPKPKEACTNAKPEVKRACQLLKARMATWEICNTTLPNPNCTQADWISDDAWRENVLQLLGDIFSMACSPMIKSHYAVNVNRVIKGYLIDFVKGTLPYDDIVPPICPVPGPGGTCAPIECVPQVGATPVICNVSPLPVRRQFWDEIIQTLENCKKRNPIDNKLYFRRVQNETTTDHFVFLKENFDTGDYTEMEMVYNMEQADQEFAFNYAIDSLWRIFATTLGICMPYYETSKPGITTKFYSYFSEDFFHPLSREWTRNRDNAVFERIFGEYYDKRTDFWSAKCMEASFMNVGEKWRPPRKLMVNGGVHMNYFIEGPLAGTYGSYK